MEVVSKEIVFENSHSRNSISVQLPLEPDEYEDKSSSTDISVIELDYPEGGKKAWCTVFAAFIGLTAEFGLINSMGAIESYVTTNILPDVSGVAISMVFSIYVFIVMGVMMISGILFDKYGYKELCYSGSVLLIGGLFATGNCTQLWQFFLAFSLCCGLGCALLTSPLVTAVGHFFNKRRGLAMSVVMPGASLGGVIWPLVCRSLYKKVGFTWTMRILGFIFLGILLLTCLMMNDRHEEIQEIRFSNESKEKGKWSHITDLIDLSVIKDQKFLWMTIAICMNEFSVIMVTTYIPNYALSKGFGQSMSLISLTVCNASGVIGRLIPALLSDHYGPFNMILIMSFIMTISIFIIWLPFGEHLQAFLTFCVIFGFSMAATLSLTPLCTSAISDPEEFGKRYGTAYFFVSFINLIALPIGMALSTTSIGYDAMAAFGGCTSFIAFASFLICRYKVGGYKVIKV
ncbi:hypothetical protein DAMA08_053030 [Martiniozyma asiatica (nom. inval.)]|nr:hypothetical protein DAMA08_053030 [Martiniozyma asiatica]